MCKLCKSKITLTTSSEAFIPSFNATSAPVESTPVQESIPAELMVPLTETKVYNDDDSKSEISTAYSSTSFRSRKSHQSDDVLVIYKLKPAPVPEFFVTEKTKQDKEKKKVGKSFKKGEFKLEGL
jgi:hypothetical protein